MTKPAPRDDRADAPRITPPLDVAAGLPAVVAATKQVVEQMGVRRGARALFRVNQVDGFDCPGCAWPEPSDRSHAEFCENGAKAVAEEATLRRVDASFFAAHSIDDLLTRSDHWLGQQGRLTEPMVKRAGRQHYEPFSWDDAFDLIAAELRALDSPDRAVFYTSGRTSNEAAFLYQLFVRELGTNNLPDCSNLCHESSSAALTETIGFGKSTVRLEDVEDTDLIFVVGQNPGTNHPRMLGALEQAKRNGAQIVAVNPMPEAGLLAFRNPQRLRGVLRGVALADQFLQVRVNGDLALFLALNKLLLEDDSRRRGAVDHDFVDRYCDGYDDLARHLEALSWDPILHASGLAREEIEEVYRRARRASRIVVCWAMGLTQHRNAVATIREIVNFLLLRGSIGRQGAGPCPVRGHSNVQGDRTMGISESPTAEFLDALRTEFSFVPPRRSGYDVVEAIRAMDAGSVDVFFAMGGNFAAAAPDTGRTAEALRRCRLTVNVSTKLNRSHALAGDTALILPCLGRTEVDEQESGVQFVSVEDSMGLVHASRGRLPPASTSLRSEVAIVAGLAARALGDRSHTDWMSLASDYDAIRERIARVVPGFERFNDHIRQPGGFSLPHPVRDERRFRTPSGRAQLTVNALDVIEVPEGHLLLQTLRSHDQYNTTIYGYDDRYRGVKGGRRVVFVNPADLVALGFTGGDVVDIVNEHSDGRERRVREFTVVSYPVARETCAVYFPEGNPLVPLDSTAEISNTPTSKSIVVHFEPIT